jgi:circadian clock protein KaiC
VAIDTVEALFAGLPNEAILRAELRRLFRWLKDKGVTAVITGEQGENTLTRHGLEEYVSDCVILLDHRVVNQVATRRLRVVKYRGSAHGTNEYPTLIDEHGLSWCPSARWAWTTRVQDRGSPAASSAGRHAGRRGLLSRQQRPDLGHGRHGQDQHGGGLCRQRPAAAAKRCLYFSFEESPDQIVRNMRSIGFDLEPWVRKGLAALPCGALDLATAWSSTWCRRCWSSIRSPIWDPWAGRRKWTPCWCG